MAGIVADVAGPAQHLEVRPPRHALVEPGRRPGRGTVADERGDDVLVPLQPVVHLAATMSTSLWCARSATTCSSSRPPAGAQGRASIGRSTTCSSSAATRSSCRSWSRPRASAGELRAHALRVPGVGEPGAGPPGDAHGGDAAADDVGREEVRRDEILQRPAEGVLAGRDERGVRDRQPERAAEERGHGEPVGCGADHGRLAGGVDEADPAGLVQRDDVTDGGEPQQPRRHRLHPTQRAAPGAVGVRQQRPVGVCSLGAASARRRGSPDRSSSGTRRRRARPRA